MKPIGQRENRRPRCRYDSQAAILFIFLTALTASGQLPDLTIHAPATDARVIFRTFAPDDCEVIEGCATPGTRRLLNFTTEIRNVGFADLNMGRPENNPNFIWADCHGHYHFEDFAHYRLLDSTGNTIVARGTKMAFCLEDTYRWRASAAQARRYSCGGIQGIQAGWADVYDAAVPCQYIDITGLPGGNYILEMQLDPLNRITEGSKNNNIVRVPVTLPSDCPVPANDAFAGAQTLTGAFANARSDNVCAGKEAGEPNHAGDAGGHSLWFQWTAPYSGVVTINTVGSDFDTLLAVYTGNAVNSLTLIAQNDDIVPFTNVQSQISFNASSNTVYRIAVDGWGGSVGAVWLNINPPANDAFANCQSISGPSGQVTGHNIGATKQNGEVAHAGNIGGHSVWYCWTAPTSGTWTFDTINSDFDTLLAVYTGNNVSSLTTIASDDNSGGNDRSLVSFNAAAGTNYRIAVDGFSGATGTIRLRWTTLTRLAIRRVSGGNVEIAVTGPPGTCHVQASGNLASWGTIATFTMTSSPYRLTNSAGFPARFYRVVRP